VFYRERHFSEGEYMGFMKAQSTPRPESLEVLADLSRSGKYLLATLNNESRELNEYRIDTFGLRDHFSLFLSSCYLGIRKPEPEIYRTAVEIVQREPEACVFVDDRELNLECAALHGIEPVHFTGAAQLKQDLAALGVVTG
jgi:putative hydrolase of the HAD superfamily